MLRKYRNHKEKEGDLRKYHNFVKLPRVFWKLEYDTKTKEGDLRKYHNFVKLPRVFWKLEYE